MTEEAAPQSTGSLNIVSDAATIYQGGQFTEVTISDLRGNEVALRQLVNSYNQLVKDNTRLAAEKNELKVAEAKSELRPLVLVPASIASVIGAAMVGVATNYVTGPTARSMDYWILGGGLVLALLGAVVPIWYSHSIKVRR